MNICLLLKTLMVLLLCFRKDRIFLHLSNIFFFMFLVRRCHGCLKKDLRAKSRLTGVLMVLRSTFKVLACLLMLTVGSSVILSLIALRKTLLLFLWWPPLPGDLFVPLPSFLACWMCCTVLSLTPMILVFSFWGVCAYKRSII